MAGRPVQPIRRRERAASGCLTRPTPPRMVRPLLAGCACIAYIICMQYTIRNIPDHVDRALRKRAEREGKSLNEVATEALTRGLDLEGQPVRHRDLSSIAGSWVRDRDVERALEEQRKIDPDLWR